MPRSAPLIFAFLAFAAGIFCREAAGPLQVPGGAAPAMMVTGLLAAARAFRAGGWSGTAFRAAVLVWLFLAGTAAGQRSTSLHRRAVEDAAAWIERPAWFSGRVCRPPTSGLSGTALIIDLDSAAERTANAPRRLRLRLRLSVPTPDPDLHRDALPGEGARITFFAVLRAPRAFGNPGAFDYGRYLESRGVGATARLKSPRLVRVIGPGETTTGQRFRDLVARTVESRFRGNAGTEVAGALLLSCLTGDRRRLTPGLRETLRQAGLGHLLALSGMHVGLLGSLAALLLTAMRMPIRLRRWALIIFFLTYHELCSAGPSLTRAVAAAVLFLAGAALGFRPGPLNSVAAAGLGILAADPLMVDDAGFQLSFSATIAIIVIVPVLVDRGTAGRTAPGVPLRLPRVLAAVSFAAFLGTAMLQAALFHQATPAAVAANIAAGPLLWCALASGICCLATDLAAVPAPGPLGPLLDGTANLACRFVRVAAGGIVLLARTAAPLAIPLPSPGPALLVTGYGALALSTLAARSPRLSGRLPAFLLLCCSPCLLLVGLAVGRQRPPANLLRVTFLDVGQGDASIIEFPDGRVLVLDGGAAPPTATLDYGRLAVSPALWHHGMHHVDTVALSHGHGDHAGGLASVIDAFRPRRLITGRLLGMDLPAARGALSAAAGRACAVVRLHRGMVLRRGDADLVVLHPPPPGLTAAETGDANNRSLVLLLRHGQVRMLFSGDLERAGEGMVLASPLARLARGCRVLKTGHHGAPDANGRGWLEHVSPEVAVVTAGRRNRFGHPDPALAGRLAAVGCRRIHRTGVDGALTVLSDGRDILLRVETRAGE